MPKNSDKSNYVPRRRYMEFDPLYTALMKETPRLADERLRRAFRILEEGIKE